MAQGQAVEQVPAAAQVLALERGRAVVRAQALGLGAPPWKRAMRRCAPEARRPV